MIVLDTNVLVYAKGFDHPLRRPCRSILDAVRDGNLEVRTTTAVIQEFVHVRSRRHGRADAVELGLEYAILLAPLLIVQREHVVDGLAMYAAGANLDAFDAVLAASARSYGAEALVSSDPAFGEVGGLRHVDPASGELEGLLRPAT